MSVTARRNSVARAAFWMVLADAGFVAMLLGIKQLSHDLTVAEIVFWRSLVASAAVLPSMLTRGQRQVLVTRRFRYFVTRAVIVYGANLGYFYAAVSMVLADAVSLQFVIPLFTLIGAAIFLGEKVGARRWAATAVGFAGAVVILRPGFAEIGWPAVAVLVSSALYAQNWLMVKSLTATDSARAIVFYMNVLLAPLALIGAVAFGWTWPSWSLAPLIIATGLAGWAAQLAQARGFAAADASVVAPFDFLRLPMTAAAAYILWGEQADEWTWVGAFVIFAAATYITRREAKAESKLRRDDDADRPRTSLVKVVGVRRLGGHKLEIEFSDGTVGVRDFAFLASRTGAMVEPLKDPSFFARVFIEDGALTWPNGYDWDPIALHDEMKAEGLLRRADAAE